MWYTVYMDAVTVAFIWDEKLHRFSAYVSDVPAYGEGATKEEALADLRKAIALYIEEVGRDQFLSEVIAPLEYETFKLSSLV